MVRRGLVCRCLVVVYASLPLSVRSLSSSSSSSSSNSHWEELYYTGRSMTEESTPKPSIFSDVRVVSFDLDNTLWKTGPTIHTANLALSEFLQKYNIPNGHIIIPDTMKQLAHSQKEQQRYASNLTKLRKDAIQRILEYNNYPQMKASQIAQQGFEVWKQARHDATLQNLANHVPQVLHMIRQLQAQAGHPLIIGAITDGNADPMQIPQLASFFDFCINAEGVGVSKPDPKIYLHAVATVVQQNPCLHDLHDGDSRQLTYQDAERILGPWWVHIGDDFAKDIVGAKGLGMRSIWARELVLDKIMQEQRRDENTRTVEDLINQVSSQAVVKMQVGSEDYLLDSLQNEFADAVVDTFQDLSSVIQQWIHEASDKNTEDSASSTSYPTYEEAPPQTYDQPYDQMYANYEQESQVQQSPEASSKFCIHCGTSIPVMAKFCSACGQQQQ